MTYNVNGLAASCQKKGLAALLARLEACAGAPIDIVCLQETKLRPQELTVALGQAPGW